MDIYHVWCDLKPGVTDLEFGESVQAYMQPLQDDGRIERWRLTRCKLGLAPSDLGEWHIMIETRDMAQLEEAFRHVACRRDPVEAAHFGVNSLVRNARFALYRDFPDAFRHHGEERF